MGEITEMILDGTLCQVCGAFMEDLAEGAIKQPDGTFKIIKEPPGYPRTCKECLKEGIEPPFTVGFEAGFCGED